MKTINAQRGHITIETRIGHGPSLYMEGEDDDGRVFTMSWYLDMARDRVQLRELIEAIRKELQEHTP